MAKSILDTARRMNFNEDYDADFIYIERYLKAIKQYRTQNPNYNCVINIRDTKTGQVIQYSIDDLEKEYQQYLSVFPHKIPRYTTEFEFREVLIQAGYPKLESFEPKDSNSALKAEAFLKEWFNLKTLSKSWKVFPKDTRTELGDSVSAIGIAKVPLTEQEKTRRMLISYQYLESSDYLFKIEGINEFEGYIGYVYRSGKVVLEKFYDNFNTKKVVTNCATYIIKDFNKLVEISMLSKSKIMKGMREGELQGVVSREFHYIDMERWKSKIDQAIVGNDYTEEIMKHIDYLIKQGKIQQKGTTRN